MPRAETRIISNHLRVSNPGILLSMVNVSAIITVLIHKQATDSNSSESDIEIRIDILLQ